jgi:hypothetical protein
VLVLTSQVGREALALEVRRVRPAVPRVRRQCLQPARALSLVWKTGFEECCLQWHR